MAKLRSLAALALATSSLETDAGLSFLTIGDWGGAALEYPDHPYAQNVKDVSAQMGKTATEKDAKFVVNTGDNFYWCGIRDTSDFQVATDWLEPFKATSLQVPWYSILGNHEYGYNVDAQLELSKEHPTWVMDARYYSRRVQLDSSNYASFVFLDTSPCISEYRASAAEGWDPCSPKYPTCSLSGAGDDFEGACGFNANINSQDCSKQLAWLKDTLSKIPKDDWVIIVGHHPGDEPDVEDLTGAIQEHGFDLYLNGHAHLLSYYHVDGKGAYVTSGAGSLVQSADQLGGTPGKDRTYNKVNDLEVELMADPALSASGHSYSADFTVKKTGFTSHTFSDDYSSLTTDFLDVTGSVLYSFTVKKGSAVEVTI
ncbi:unnamed protein product [Polarella glacialis]|uniref:Calcineurin-like phosphoesterase domain-containing protein n=1 Tax=Polarella glacialis TaxID=89957 RepID=A0A813FAS2_POLGL|nr:unnamed protein product [Polarella glacialis]